MSCKDSVAIYVENQNNSMPCIVEYSTLAMHVALAELNEDINNPSIASPIFLARVMACLKG